MPLRIYSDLEPNLVILSISPTKSLRVYSDQYLDGQDMSFNFEPTYQHKRGQEGYITLQTVDEQTFKFYDNLDRQKLSQFNPFVEPVFIQPGQFGKAAIGVFGAFAVSDSVKLIYPE